MLVFDAVAATRNAVNEMEDLPKPDWLPEDIYHYILFKARSGKTQPTWSADVVHEPIFNDGLVCNHVFDVFHVFDVW